MMRSISITTLTAMSLLQAMPVKIEGDGQPVPERATLRTRLAAAPDAETAADTLLVHYHEHGYPAVGVEMEDLNGVRRAQVDVARYGDIWLSEGPPRTKKIATHFFQDLNGQFVHRKILEERLDAFHRNPWHRAVPALQPSSDGSKVNALLKIEQSQAHHFSAGYHDSGASPLPRERLWLQAEFSDLWQLSSLSKARLTASPDPEDFQALQLGSQFYLKNGQEFGINLSYSGAKQDGLNSFDAYTWQVGTHWHSDKAEFDSWSYHSQIGLNYRSTNNALEFGNSSARGLAKVFQISAGQEWEKRADHSLTRISGSALVSPGGDDNGHASLRSGARSRYLIARAHLWHRHDLPKQWDLITHVGGQWSSDPVIQGDQIALGGASGLRGLSEQFALGDRGIISGLELRTPVFQLPRQWKIRPSIFLQAGKTTDLVTSQSTEAITSGLGLQIGLSDHLRASVHGGWRLDERGNEFHSQLTWNF